jgi:hypothetical protein
MTPNPSNPTQTEDLKPGATVYIKGDKRTLGRVVCAQDGGWLVDWGNDVQMWHLPMVLSLSAAPIPSSLKGSDVGEVGE